MRSDALPRIAGILAAMLVLPWAGAQSTSVTLSSSPNPVILGQPLTLTAVVPIPGASGTVTFFDSTTILGIRTVSAGQAALTTTLLPAGSRSLRAFYSGDATHAGGTSSVVNETVATAAANGFGPPMLYSVVQPNVLAVADLNGDGNADLIAANSTQNSVNILLGNGDGTFRPPATYAAGQGVSSIAIGDFNGDGKADLAVTNAYGGASGGSVTVLLGNGDGTFQTAVSYPSGSDCTSIVAGDFNGDGKTDLAVVNTYEETISVFLGNGDGTFQRRVNYVTGPTPVALAAVRPAPLTTPSRAGTSSNNPTIAVK